MYTLIFTCKCLNVEIFISDTDSLNRFAWLRSEKMWKESERMKIELLIIYTTSAHFPALLHSTKLIGI